MNDGSVARFFKQCLITTNMKTYQVVLGKHQEHTFIIFLLFAMIKNILNITNISSETG